MRWTAPATASKCQIPVDIAERCEAAFGQCLKAMEPSFRIGSFVSLGTVLRAHRETIEAALREVGLPG